MVLSLTLVIYLRRDYVVFSLSTWCFSVKMKHIITAVELEWFAEYVTQLQQLVWLRIVLP